MHPLGETKIGKSVADERQELRAEIDRLRERCEAYKGQVETGAVVIERMRAALDDIACEPEARASALVYHGRWEEFARQLVSTARKALGNEQIADKTEE